MRFVQKNDLISSADGTTYVRVLDRGPVFSWVITTFPETDLPHEESTHLLDSMISFMVQGGKRPAKREITRKMRTKAAADHQRLAPVLEDDRMLYTRQGRWAAYQALKLKDSNLTFKVFLRLVRAWFAGGRTEEAFLPRWDDCGHSVALDLTQVVHASYPKAMSAVVAYASKIELPESNAPPSKKSLPGRPRQAESGPSTFFRVNFDALVMFRHYHEIKRNTAGMSLKKVHSDMLTNHFSNLDPFGREVLWDERRLPSLDQFTYWYRQLYSHEQRRRTQGTNRKFDLTERPILGDEMSLAAYAGALGHADATIWNFYIRSRFPDRGVIGAPVVFRIRELRTGMLLGLSVSLENANWMCAASAIANAMEDKVAFCRKYGIDISEDDWPVRGLPGTIEADGGETNNTKPARFIKLTGCQLNNMPRHRPDLRGGNESDWNTLEVSMAGDTPGAVIAKWEERTGTDWKIRGTLDIDSFTELLLAHELRKMKQPRTDVLLTPEMIAAGVDGSSLSMWNYSMQYEGGGLMQFEQRAVQLSLLSLDSGSIRADGIYFQGIYYQCDDAGMLTAYARARKRGTQPVDIAYDERLVDDIWIYQPLESEMYLRCTLNLRYESQRDFAGKRFAEVRQLFRKRKENQTGDTQSRLQEEADFRARQARLLARSADETRAADTPDQSKSQKKAGIAARREEERNVHSPHIALRPDGPRVTEELQSASPPSLSSNAEDSEAADYQAFLNKLNGETT
jgi:hypothetical protein